jgi:RHS repeat-associated protein
MSQNDTSVSVPEIRLFQFESNAIGAFNKSVNLFRGDVNYSQKLFSMPGRANSQQLVAELSVMYQSNLQNEVSTQNLNAPTGVLGLGWSFPLNKIELTTNGSFSNGNQSYNLESNGISGALILTKTVEGKEYYQLEEYEFWIICYDAKNELWEVTMENGITNVYGGSVETTPKDYKTSKGNSIAWGVRYGNWTGTTRLTNKTKPQQYARTWYLCTSYNVWGDTIAYEYNGFERKNNGLLETVEQFVGNDQGMPYTKAMYLTKMTDVFGRTAVFNYDEKEYNTSAKEAEKEYQAANSTQPENTTPNAFQDRYETKYLKSISLNDSIGHLLETISFEYYGLKNLSNFLPDSLLYGNTYKRYLKSILNESSVKTSLPSFDFTYYHDKSVTDVNKGALQSVTIPQGAMATYSYKKQDLDFCNRSLEILPPSTAIIGNGTLTPRVWFGEDYAVVTWFNVVNEKLWFGIYNWVGYWKLWTPKEEIIHTNLDYSSLNVMTSGNTIGLTMKDDQKSFLYLFSKNPRQVGSWNIYDNKGENYLTFSADQGDVSYDIGNDFMLINQRNSVDENNILSRVTWNWKAQNWITELEMEKVESIRDNNKILFTKASSEYYLSMIYNASDQQNSLTLNYRQVDADGNVNWKSGETKTIKDINPYRPTSQLLATGSSTLALVIEKSNFQVKLDYDLYILQWDENYHFNDESYLHKSHIFKDKNGNLPVSCTPSVISNSIVTSGDTVLRFNGEKWLVNESLQVINPNSRSKYLLAHGNDYTLRTINTPSISPEVDLLVYDPDNEQEITEWKTKPFNVGPAPTFPYGKTDYFPTTGGADFFACGKHIYSRGASSNWDDASQKPVFTIDEPFESSTFINQGPFFMAYMVNDAINTSNSKTIVLELENGFVKDSGFKLNEQIYSSDNSSGKAPAGSNSMVTFPSNTQNRSLDNAKSITLHRYAGNSISGKVTHYPVDHLTISTGFEEYSPTTYVFDPAQATCDPSGKVAKYYESVVYPGSDISEGIDFGSVVNRFVNGYVDNFEGIFYLNGKEKSGVAPYPTLDGSKLSVIIRDANNDTVQCQRFIWDIFTVKNQGPINKSEEPEQLYGSYMRQRGMKQELDGVQSFSTSNYIPEGFEVPFSGMVIDEHVGNYNGEGKHETLSSSTIYGYEMYPELLTENDLSSVIQITKHITPDGEPGTIVGSEANRWKQWDDGQWGKFQTYQLQDPKNHVFPFRSPDEDVEGWLKQDEITVINQCGMILEMNDLAGLPNSILYDKNSEFVVAQFQNASLASDEADYYGFDNIEQGLGWLLNNETKIINGNCFTGFQSAYLAKSGSLSKRYKPRQKQVYVVSYWYKTAPNYVSEPNSGWFAQISGGEIDTVQKPFENTDGRWVFEYFLVDLSAHQPDDTIEMYIEAQNHTTEAVYIDNIRMTPNLSNFSAYTYEPNKAITTAQMGSGKHLERVLYDEFSRRIGTVGPYEENVNEFSLVYYSRQGNSDGFSASDPNSQVKIQALEGGVNQTFLDSDGWKRDWEATNTEKNWLSGNGQLIHLTAEVSDTLKLRSIECKNNFFVAFGLQSMVKEQALMLADKISISIGEDNCFSWDPIIEEWSFTVAGKVVNAISNWKETPINWGLVFKENTVLLYVNGRILLSETTDTPQSGEFSICTGKNKFSLNYLTLIKAPKVGVIFNNALAVARQNQALNGANGIISQIVSNQLGKSIVTTKPAPAFFGDIGRETPLMTYRDRFIDMASFLLNLDKSGEMLGDLSTYYNGEYDSSDDQNYPFSRSLLEKSPMMRVVEEGIAGKPYAIICSDSGKSLSENTVKYRYGNSNSISTNGRNGFDTGEYYLTERIDQNGVPTQILTTKIKENHQTTTPVSEESSSQNYLVCKNSVIYTDTGRLETTLLPNFFDDSIPGHDQFKITKRFDILNNLIEVDSPDLGSIKAIYDNGGQLRFVLDAEGSKHGYYGYIKYDVLNRMVEKGFIIGKWDPKFLQEYSNIESYPGTKDNSFTQKKLTYGNFLNNINHIGLVTEIKTFDDEDESIIVSENYTYDDSANVCFVDSVVTDASNTLNNTGIGYCYSSSGLIRQINYPSIDGISVGSVYHSYDDLGRLIGIGNSEKEFDTYANYNFTLCGLPAESWLNNKSIDSQLSFNQPGWLKSIMSLESSQGLSEQFDEYYPTGLIKSLSETLTGNDFNSTLNLLASYDPSGSLTSVIYDEDKPWSLDALSYDPNGNFVKLIYNSNEETYSYNEGTNKTRLIERKDSSIGFDYNDNGAVSNVSASATPPESPLSFNYIKEGYLTRQIEIGNFGDRLDLFYGGKGQRVMKRLIDREGVKKQKFYTHGLAPLPLIETTEEGTTAYIYGTQGLISFEREELLHFVVKDHLGSNRVVYDIENTIQAAWSYSTFGERQIVFGQDSNLLSYLFAGQEWDEEVGLYNFRARMYDSRLRQFYVADPMSQYASSYVFNGNDPLNRIDPSGLWSLGQVFTEIGETIASAVEIGAGMALDAVGAEPLGGALIGAGTNGLTSMVAANIGGNSLSWKDFGKSEAIGAATGLVTAGIGSVGKSIGSGLADSTKAIGATEAAQQSLKTIIGTGAVKGLAGGVTGTMVGNAVNGNHWDEGVGKSAWTGAVNGVISSGIGAAARGLTDKDGFKLGNKNINLSGNGKKITVSILAGMTSAASASLINTGANGDRFEWSKFGADIGTGVVNTVMDESIGAGKQKMSDVNDSRSQWFPPTKSSAKPSSNTSFKLSARNIK